MSNSRAERALQALPYLREYAASLQSEINRKEMSDYRYYTSGRRHTDTVELSFVNSMIAHAERMASLGNKPVPPF